MSLRTQLGRLVGHIDIDYFYAQVEEVENPSLKGTPLLICVYSGRTEDSGVVSTANYKAREYGIRSGMPIALAKRKLKQVEAVFLPMAHEKYELVSGRIMKLVKSRVDMLEQTGIDEAFFDVTRVSNGDYGQARAIALGIKEEVFSGERLTVSIGIAPNKVVAKIASDFKKSDGLTIVTPQEVEGFLSSLSVDKIFGVGVKTTRILESRGIKTVSQLAATPLAVLEEMFDRKLAFYLRSASRGDYDEPVIESGEATQLSRILTLKKDSSNIDEIYSQLSPAIEDVSKKAQTKKVVFKTISIIGILRDLSIRTRSRSLTSPTNDLFTLQKNSFELLKELVESSQHDLRRVGVKVGGLASSNNQSSLAEYLNSDPV